MARDFQIQGESLVLVKGPSDSGIPGLMQLGLAADPIRVTPQFNHADLKVNAWGNAPPDVQWMLGTVNVSMTLIHFDPVILETCVALSMGGGQPAFGQMARAGTRLGNNIARFQPGNSYIGLNIAAPIDNLPWCFRFSYLQTPPFDWPLGVEASMVQLNWRVVPYTQDPWNNGLGADDYPLWTRVLDT